MTKAEYASFEARVAAFMEREGIDILASDSDDEGSFSWRRCDCCDSRLGGTRYSMIGASAGVGPNGFEYSCCTDCLYYSVYGCLDDETMLLVASA